MAPTVSKGVRLFLFANRWLLRTITGLQAFHEGLWTGLLSERSLDDLTAYSYAFTPAYFSREHNQRGLMPWEEAAIHDHFPKSGTVLIAAAGAGREARALADRGYDVTAFDCCDDLVAEGMDVVKGKAVKFHTAQPSQVPPGAGRSEAAVIGWGGYGHIHPAERRIEFLQQMHAALTTAAPLLLSFLLATEEGRAHGLRTRVAQVAGRLRGKRIASGDRIRMDAHPTFVHLFTRDEIERELEAGGFTVLKFETAPEPHCVARRL